MRVLGPDGQQAPEVDPPGDKLFRSLLWLAPGAAAAVFILGSLGAFGAQTIAVQTSPDGLWRVELSSVTTTTPKFELWATSTVSGVRRRIGHPVPHDYDVFEFVVSGDSSRVVYRQGRTATGESALYSSPIDRSGGAIISPPVSQGGRVSARISLEPGGHRVRYGYAEQAGSLDSTRIVGVAGGYSYRELFADNFESGGATIWR